MPKSAWGQSPRHLAFTITKITSSKFRDPAQTYTGEGQSPDLGAIINTEDPLNGYVVIIFLLASVQRISYMMSAGYDVLGNLCYEKNPRSLFQAGQAG
ncbi:hypothetical protein Dthio_PD0600 [Desulfonatronospira thiodismutans ASO3-1]|uniref:Uncharacterized protein n=1 Tax=Desulfonatronospira thiodismutans ASO3-1 TaxID=555779 RepID=D6SRF8_9BACT|nr:hypothetical protein Dthio_PD0600 [Desulfonatronospira thiodismutans ASO3-1]